jgi:toxin ParE1/3/4
MTAFLLLPGARRDLASIWQYTAKHWSSDQAERYTAEIVDACRAVSEGHRQGRPIDDIRPGYFKIAVRSHVVYYRVRNDGVYIVARILHQRMDTSAHIR